MGNLTGILDHQRMPLDKQKFTWKEMAGKPISKLDDDAFTRVRVMGVMQVLTEPRTNLARGRGALLTVELEDNAAWELLIELAEAGGHPKIAKGFHKAKEQEDDHVVKIKSRLRKDLLSQVQ
ncbi:hypothetical protein [Stutzerimonas stutzeri]|uniref:hypothetical protein n=1 Tax=Stutzerimonas stutzeri TaxID=316 RepID=UPI003C6F6135